MPLINCPNCNRNISDVTAMCPYCGFRRGEVSDERARELRRRMLRDRIYHLSMISYAAIALFLAAFGWYWWESAGFLKLPTSGPVALVALSSVGYLSVRVLLFRARRMLRRLR